MVPFFKGFKDSSLSIFEASCILHKYERRTGLTVTREELDSGTLREKLDPSDYDTSCLVSSPIILTFQDRLQPTRVYLLDFWQISCFPSFGDDLSVVNRGIVRTPSRDFQLSPNRRFH